MEIHPPTIARFNFINLDYENMDNLQDRSIPVVFHQLFSMFLFEVLTAKQPRKILSMLHMEYVLATFRSPFLFSLYRNCYLKTSHFSETRKKMYSIYLLSDNTTSTKTLGVSKLFLALVF